MTNQLIPLHVHSNYSLLDSLIKVEDYVKWGVENNMPALALTEHGSLSSAIQFYKQCTKNNVKPILGMEAYLTNNTEEKVRDNYHLILLAKNKKGWLNLIKLHNFSFQEENMYYKPRITYEALKKYSEGLICCSACLGGHLPKLIMEKDINGFMEYLLKYKEIFNDDFYIELQDHGIEQQKPVNKVLAQVAKKTNTKLILTNDSHYTNSDDSYAHQVLLCKQTQAKITDEKKMSFHSAEFYLKNTEQMKESIKYLGEDVFNECVESSNEIADKVEEYDILQHEYNYPVFGDKKESLQKLIQLSKEGFERRFKNKDINRTEYLARLKYEINSIYSIGFMDYFLLLDDLYKYCDAENIFTGYGRGSSSGSLVLYCLNVTHLDPIKYNLLFERFINPERVNPPDADCDIASSDRYKVINYIKEKYGEEYVCGIATYTGMTSVASFKAVSSVFNMPFFEANNISQNLIDTSMSLAENIESNEKLNTMYNTKPDIKEILDIAMKIEGGNGARGVHPAGIIICNQPLENITPVIKAKDKEGVDMTVSCYEMSEVDKDLKLLKLDILGLKTLTILKEAIERTGKDINFKQFEFDDEKTFDLLRKGQTLGVFQLESSGMASLSRRLETSNFEDIGSLVALFRPGPLESGMVDKFVERKHGREEITYVHECLEPILKDTYGTIVYQEQIMQVAQALAGYSLGQADLLRRAMGKKDKEEMEKNREGFISGCDGKITNQQAKDLFEEIEQFAKYSFNRAHSAVYAGLAYATAYMKANYPVEYLTALMNMNASNNDKLNLYIEEAYRLNIDLKCPDVNKSKDLFEHDLETSSIVFGFSGIKNTKAKAIQAIVLERKNGKYTSFVNLLERVPSLDKSTLESLIKSGALNSIEQSPYKYLSLLDFFAKVKAKADYKKGNISLYNGAVIEMVKAKLSTIESFTKLVGEEKGIKTSKKDLTGLKEQLRAKINYIISSNVIKFEDMQYVPDTITIKNDETELLGFPISVNPKKALIQFKDTIGCISIKEFKDSKDYHDNFVIMATLKNISKTRNGSYFAIFSDESAEITTFISAENYENNQAKLITGSIFRIYCQLGKSYKPEKYDDNLKPTHMRYFNIGLTGSLIKLKCNLDNEKLSTFLTKIRDRVILNEEDINYRLEILNSDNIIRTNIDFWVSDLESISDLMIEYNVMIG